MIIHHPDALILLLLPPVFALLYVIRSAARRAALERIAEGPLLEQLMQQVSPTRRRWKVILWLGAVLSIILALAWPGWGTEITSIETSGPAVIFALDISQSMNAQDIQPSRLERAKLDIQTILQQLQGTHAGLVIFAGNAQTLVPITFDLNAIDTFLDFVNSEATNQSGTDIGATLEHVAENFDPRSGRQATIVLLTDGEDHSGQALPATENLSDADIRVITVGYGQESGSIIPVLSADGNTIDYRTDANGVLIETRLNQALLQQIAEASGGFYAVGGSSDIFIVADTIEGGEGIISEQIVRLPVTRYAIFALIALALLSAEILLSEARRGRN